MIGYFLENGKKLTSLVIPMHPIHPEHVIQPIPPKPTNVAYPMIPRIGPGHKVKPLGALFRLTAVKRHVCCSTPQLWDDTGVALLKGLRNKKIINYLASNTNLPLGWNILETNLTVGGLLGYSSVNSIVSLKVPSSKGVSWGLKRKPSKTILNCTQ